MNIIKQLLQESEGYLTDENDIFVHLRQTVDKRTKLEDFLEIKDGVVNMRAPHTVTLKFTQQLQPKVKFGKLYNIDINAHDISHERLDWIPKHMERGTLYLNDCSGVTIDKMPECDSIDFISFYETPIQTLKGIHKKIKKAETLNLRRTFVRNSILGLCLIEGLYDNGFPTGNKVVKKVYGHDAVAGNVSKKISEFEAAMLIIIPHLGGGKKAVLDAQEELIEMDLDDYAQL